MDSQAAKQQIVDRVKQAENILVTVSANPSVDQLASCIGLALLFNKMGKSATAVYSGKTPSTIEFLQPEQMLSPSPDALRDFIISLDKNKADKLRYKIEDQVVRIFITPYKAKLTQGDLQFSEGDFNVDVIITLGVTDRASLDGAISAHGRILHDATVIALSAGAGKAPDLGQINWQDTNASSLAEMLVSLSEGFGPNLIDNQSATAFLTGIVAETERFSNKKTSPKVMTMSAQLMAAGANQQLVISKLTPPPPVAPPPKPAPPPQPPKPKPQPPKPPQPPKQEQAKPKEEPKKEEKPKEIKKEQSAGVLSVDHGGSGKSSEEVEINTSEIHIDTQGNLKLIEDGPNSPGKEQAKEEDKNKEENKDQPKEEPKKEEPVKEEKPEEKIKPIEPSDPLPVEMHLVTPPNPMQAPPPPPIPEQKPPEVLPPPPIPAAPAPTPPPAVDTSSPKLNDLGDLPPLPPPEPIPSIRIGNPATPHISATAATPAPAPLPPPPPPSAPSAGSGHAVLDPLRQPPHLGASFSADTNEGWGGGGSNNALVDPVNNVPLNPQGGEAYSQAKQMAPPAPHQSPLDQLLANNGAPAPATAPAPASQDGLTEASARAAVENAFSGAPFNPANNPQTGVGATPLGPQLHQPPTQPPAYDDATPSLNLPVPPAGAPPITSPPPPAAAPPPPAPPPPGPPPFMPPPSL
jgi:hypothetical protein